MFLSISTVYRAKNITFPPLQLRQRHKKTVETLFVNMEYDSHDFSNTTSSKVTGKLLITMQNDTNSVYLTIINTILPSRKLYTAKSHLFPVN